MFTCPPQTETQKFILLNGVCVGTDINCDQSNQDGSCGVCKDGFYVSEGRCVRQNNANNFLTIENIGNDQLREDESNNFYILRSDGSRYYLTGTWKNLQVWADISNSLYIKVSNGRRQYLTGPYERLYVY